MRSLLIFVFGLTFLALPSDGFAQDPLEAITAEETERNQERDARRRALRGEPLDELSREELVRRGFVFRDENARSDDATAVVLSLTAGLAVHGIGHLYMGDTTTGGVLLGSQILSMLLLAGAGVAFAVTDGSSAGNAVIAPLFSSGLALYVFSYLADVAGTINGPDSAFPPPSELGKLTFSTMYGFTSSRGSPVRHALNARVDADLKWVQLSAQTTQDIFLDTAVYAGHLAFSPLHFQRSQSGVSIESHIEHVRHSGRGPFGRSSLDGRLVGKLDSGDLFEQLDGFVLYVEGGYGTRWWSFANENNALEVQTQTNYVPFDFGVESWLTRRLKVRGGYGSPRSPFVAAVTRILGVAHLGLTYKTSKTLDLRIRGELGDGFSSWIGVGISPF